MQVRSTRQHSRLEHALERAYAVASGPLVTVDDLPEAVQKTAASCARVTPLAVWERQNIERVLAACGDDRRRTAALLGISLSTLKRRLRR